MKALLVCPDCGYWLVGVSQTPDEALKAGVVGMQVHRDVTHHVPMTPDRFITELRIKAVH